MPYSAEFSRSNPTCFTFQLDQSGSMSEGFGEAAIRKTDFVADVVSIALCKILLLGAPGWRRSAATITSQSLAMEPLLDQLSAPPPQPNQLAGQQTQGES
jgi:hypothetical protein